MPGMSNALFETMESEAAAQCEAFAADGERAANRILEEARAQCAERRREAVARMQKRLESEESVATRVAHAEAERVSLAMQQAVADEVLGRAYAEITSLPAGDRFAPLLEALLAAAMDAAPEDAVVTVPAAHLERCQQWLHGHGFGRAAVEGSATLRDGVQVRDRAQTYRVTHTLSSRFSKLERQARKAVLGILFRPGS